MAGTITPRGREIPAATEPWNLTGHWLRYDATVLAPTPVATRAEGEALVQSLTTAGDPPTASRPLLVIINDENGLIDSYADGQWRIGAPQWTPLTLPTGYSSYLETPAVSVVGRTVYFRGSVSRDAGAFPAYDIDIATVPPNFRHNAGVKTWVCPGNGDTTRKIIVFNTGNVRVIAGAASPTYLSLSPISYPLK